MMNTKLVRLDELAAGSLFEYRTGVGLKSQYRTEKGAVEAYCISSGEFFWGGTNTAKDQCAIMVRPLNFYHPDTIETSLKEAALRGEQILTLIQFILKNNS